jgi:tRNA-dihydrouridine synthase B
VGSNRYGSELQTMRSMRSRLMNYTKFLPGGKWLRMKFSTVSSVMELEDAVASYFTHRTELDESEFNSA